MLDGNRTSYRLLKGFKLLRCVGLTCIVVERTPETHAPNRKQNYQNLIQTIEPQSAITANLQLTISYPLPSYFHTSKQYKLPKLSVG